VVADRSSRPRRSLAVVISAFVYGDDRHVFRSCEVHGCVHPEHLALEAARVAQARGRRRSAKDRHAANLAPLKDAWAKPYQVVTQLLHNARETHREAHRAELYERRRARGAGA
jgi:hypothetical protein